MLRILTLFLPLVYIFACAPKNKNGQAQKSSGQYICMPIVSDKDWYKKNTDAPLFDGLGTLNFPISTANERVQTYFNQGLTLAYGFNHAEAARSFYHATTLDSTCAMAFWGYAYVLGPNYNAGMESDHYERAYAAVQQALNLADTGATELERDLIEALSTRYVKNPVDDRSALDVAYMNAMKTLHRKYPADADVATLYAESIMNIHPWDLYEKSGTPKPWTPEVLTLLENVLDAFPAHCGAHHFYIHAVEASHTPEKGLPSAKIFDDGLVPNAGHLVHMPSHIYIRTGDYHLGTLANIKAIEVDSNYIASCHAQGAYPLAYYPHNQHFLAATATLEGNSKWALYAANKVSKNASIALMKAPGWSTIQHFYTIPFYVHVKFARWDDLLKMENKVPELDYPQAIYHYARGMALLGKGDVKGAGQELRLLKKLALNDELKKVTIWDINTTYDLVQIADKVLSAEILAKQGRFEESIPLLKQAIAIEDQLNYNEPPDWFFSVRHNLGNVQLQAGLFEEAIETYQEDLQRLPKNGWALNGLVLAYDGLGNMEMKALANERFKQAWKTADVKLAGSVIH